MIKIKETFQHNGKTVCKGKLVLIETSMLDSNIVQDKKTKEMTIRVGSYSVNHYKAIKPIIISETEEDKNDLLQGKLVKILALPEHFSPELLQLIVDEKLKDGDEVIVECWNPSGVFKELDSKIKLNDKNHITLIQEESLIEQMAKHVNSYEDSMDKISSEIHSQKTWNDISRIYMKERRSPSQSIFEFISENYYPPKRK
jgi:hypothetical protein